MNKKGTRFAPGPLLVFTPRAREGRPSMPHLGIVDTRSTTDGGKVRMSGDDRTVLWLPGEPLSKARARIVRGGNYTPQSTRQAQDQIRMMARITLARRPPKRLPTVEPLCVTMHFMRGHHARRDLDNMAKLVMDALENVIWVNDSQITELHLTQEWVKYAPGTLLIVEPGNDDVPGWVAELAAEAGRPQ